MKHRTIGVRPSLTMTARSDVAIDLNVDGQIDVVSAEVRSGVSDQRVRDYDTSSLCDSLLVHFG